jgi:hypothetical protein
LQLVPQALQFTPEPMSCRTRRKRATRPLAQALDFTQQAIDFLAQRID